MKPSNRSGQENAERDPTDFEQQVNAKSRRKAQARREGDRSLWTGLGVFGMVGWSVMVPTLLGIALGRWIDHRWPSPYSWTLMLLFVGLVLGCWSAWHWIQQEQGQ
jgi:ATP synthase protein I